MFSVLGLLQQLIGREIIQKLRENHILKLLCEQTEGLTLQLMDELEDAWRIYQNPIALWKVLRRRVGFIYWSESRMSHGRRSA
jgi:hypothetical protein